MGDPLDALRRTLPGEALPISWIRSALAPSEPDATEAALAPWIRVEELGPRGDEPPGGATRPLLAEHRGPIPRYGCRRTDGGALRPPDLPRARRHPLLAEGWAPRDTDELPADSLDRALREGLLPSADVLDLRTPGGELAALKGASLTLARATLAVRARVALDPLLDGGPLFGEVDALLRRRGFLMVALDLRRSPDGDDEGPRGQPIAADALYLKDPDLPGQRPAALRSAEGLLKLGIIATAAGQAALARSALEQAQALPDTPSPLADGVAAALTSLRLPLSPEPAQDKAPDAPAPRAEPTPAALGPDPRSPWAAFHTPAYLAHNRRRMAHLASLELPLAGRSALEVGAGVGDLTLQLIQLGCQVTATDGKPALVSLLRTTLPDAAPRILDLDTASLEPDAVFDVVFCYGVLYHLARPRHALDALSARATELLLLESCVLPGDDDRCVPTREMDPGWVGSLGGVGCLPTRRWLWERLSERFAFVYCPTTQPDHPEFPTDWTSPPSPGLRRAIFVASRRPLTSPQLVAELPSVQPAR